jgi:hypothetical protein
MPYSLVKANHCFGGTYCFRLQGQLCQLPASCWFLAWLTVWPWKWRRQVPLKHRVDFHSSTACICPKERTLLSYHRNNLKSNKYFTIYRSQRFSTVIINLPLSDINQNYILTLYFYMIHFNITHPAMPRYPKYYLLFRPSD